MKRCYMCSSVATTREHFPLKSLFPKKANLQLWTVPSCPIHNNSRSKDDQYFLAQVLVNMSREGNLARERFMQAITPQLTKSEKFLELLRSGSRRTEDGLLAIPVEVARMFNVMDGICHALIFKKYDTPLPSSDYEIMHDFCNFSSEDSVLSSRIEFLKNTFERLSSEHGWMLSGDTADFVDQEVYSYKLIAPLGLGASITIEHTFYGGFKVYSLLTHKAVNGAVSASIQS